MKKPSNSPTPSGSSLPGVGYLTEVWRELNKVTWPTSQQTTRQTLLVIGVSLAIALYLGGLDYIFTELTKLLIQ